MPRITDKDYSQKHALLKKNWQSNMTYKIRQKQNDHIKNVREEVQLYIK